MHRVHSLPDYSTTALDYLSILRCTEYIDYLTTAPAESNIINTNMPGGYPQPAECDSIKQMHYVLCGFSGGPGASSSIQNV